MAAGRVLKADWQFQAPVIWVEYDSEVDDGLMEVTNFPTGQDFILSPDMTHVGSITSDHSCWHVYADKQSRYR